MREATGMRPIVEDLMHEGLITCSESTLLGDAARLLVEHQVHAIVVTDGRGTPAGVLSDVDLLSGEWLAMTPEELETMRYMTAGDLMTYPIVTIDVTAPVRIAAERMQEENVSRLVVTVQGKPVGVLSVSDLVASLATKPTGRSSVADVMTRAIVVALPDTPVGAGARAMTQFDSRALVVADQAGTVVGIVTGRDLVPLYEYDVEGKTLADLMHPPVTVRPDVSLRRAADLMLFHEVFQLVVVDPRHPGGTPLGIVSTSDIVAEMAEVGSVWRVGL
jgi:CBS domain-containing protein